MALRKTHCQRRYHLDLSLLASAKLTEHLLLLPRRRGRPRGRPTPLPRRQIRRNSVVRLISHRCFHRTPRSNLQIISRSQMHPACLPFTEPPATSIDFTRTRRVPSVRDGCSQNPLVSPPQKRGVFPSLQHEKREPETSRLMLLRVACYCLLRCGRLWRSTW